MFLQNHMLIFLDKQQFRIHTNNNIFLWSGVSHFGPEEWTLTPGDDFYVCTLDTEQGELKVGAMICYDREFPESARILMLKGAELILTPNACDMEINRLT